MDETPKENELLPGWHHGVRGEAGFRYTVIFVMLLARGSNR
jgi:hypothetical protein